MTTNDDDLSVPKAIPKLQNIGMDGYVIQPFKPTVFPIRGTFTIYTKKNWDIDCHVYCTLLIGCILCVFCSVGTQITKHCACLTC